MPPSTGWLRVTPSPGGSTRRRRTSSALDQTPPDFIFAVKASRFLTHMKRLTDMERGVERFYERIEPLVDAGKLGPVLWQLPERMHRDDDRLAHALESLPSGRHCFEFRNASWFCDAVFDLLRAHRAALVIPDHPARPFDSHLFTTDWTFIRFHHGSRGRRGNYSQTELREWATRIDAWSRRFEVFAYFNNDWEGFAVANARALRRRLEALRRGGDDRG
jgi:uncharacterized protein YecE (DUF72 family)